jgi:hypothetical protein
MLFTYPVSQDWNFIAGIHPVSRSDIQLLTGACGHSFVQPGWLTCPQMLSKRGKLAENFHARASKIERDNKFRIPIEQVFFLGNSDEEASKKDDFVFQEKACTR